jgi:hypothetical protein
LHNKITLAITGGADVQVGLLQLVQSNALLCAADLQADGWDLIGVAGGHLQVGHLQLVHSHALLQPSQN